MWKSSPNHRQYQIFLKEALCAFFILTGHINALFTRIDWLVRMWVTDLSYIHEVLGVRYSGKGRPPRDPVPLFRSLLLMAFVGETSITEWVRKLKSDPLLAILSGFYPYGFTPPNEQIGTVPGVGTFYDFIDRLWLAESFIRRRQRNKRKNLRLKKFKTKPKGKNKKGNKIVNRARRIAL